MTDKENNETALAYIQCDDEAKYRKKMKGFTLPFSTHAKDNMQELLRLETNYKFKKPKDIDKIKEEVKKLKEMRERA
jgi:hypothetical protein